MCVGAIGWGKRSRWACQETMQTEEKRGITERISLHITSRLRGQRPRHHKDLSEKKSRKIWDYAAAAL